MILWRPAAAADTEGLQASDRQTQSLDVSVGIGETDNVKEVSAAAHSQTIATAGADLALKTDGAVLKTDMTGDFNYLDYLENAFKHQLLGRFDGTASVVLLPENFSWVVQEDYGSAQLDPFVALIPTNLEDVNVVSTGPDFQLRFSRTLFLRLAARYALAHYEVSPLDGKTALGRISLGRELSAHSEFTVNADFEQLRFDNTVVNTNYDRRRFYFGYQIQGARTEITANLGDSQYNGARHWVSTPTAELHLVRALSTKAKLALTAGRQYTDSSDSFPILHAGAAGGIVIAQVAGTSATYLTNYGSASWSLQYPRTKFEVSARFERRTYAEVQASDLTYSDAELHIERKLTPRLTFTILGSVDRNQYNNLGLTYENSRAAAGLVVQLQQRLDLGIRYEHVHRNDSQLTGEFTENRGFVTLTYRPVG